MRYLFIPKLNLQLFAEGGTSTAAGALTGMGEASVNAEVVAPQGISEEDTGVKNELSEVKYGRQEGTPDAEGANEADNAVEESAKARRAAFDALIKGEYKELYDEKVNSIVRKRVSVANRYTREAEAKYKEVSPLLETLAVKYGVDPTDIKALSRAVDADNAYFSEEAMEKGVSVEELMAQKKMKNENALLRSELRKREAAESARRQYSTWMEQANAVKEFYPSFDLKAELANERFAGLLRANIDMKTAYEVIHQDELVHGAMRYTAKEVEKQVAARVAANGRRPVENRASSRSAGAVKSDVSQLTDSDIDEVMRKVMRGEKISF